MSVTRKQQRKNNTHSTTKLRNYYLYKVDLVVHFLNTDSHPLLILLINGYCLHKFYKAVNTLCVVNFFFLIYMLANVSSYVSCDLSFLKLKLNN